MKLVVTKCPNCSANLDVNPNDEIMKCYEIIIKHTENNKKYIIK